MTLNNIKPSDPVHFISSFVEKRGGAPADLQRLQHCGRQLDGDLPLSEYSISDGSTIHQLLRLRGGTLDLGPQGAERPRRKETLIFLGCRSLRAFRRSIQAPLP